MRLRWGYARVEPRDLWVGVFWDRTDDGWIAVYVCPIPCCVVRFDARRGGS